MASIVGTQEEMQKIAPGPMITENCVTSGFNFLGTNISPEKSILKMIFLFPRWDMLISWRVIPRSVTKDQKHTDIVEIQQLKGRMCSTNGGFKRVVRDLVIHPKIQKLGEL